MEYSPRPSVVAERVKPVSMRVAVTCAPGTTACDASFTVPCMPPVVTCPAAGFARPTLQNTAATNASKFPALNIEFSRWITGGSKMRSGTYEAPSA
jgi:hypothetical protein